MHTIFMREHNRIVDQLQKVNPHWSDELLYQHGRRIVSALAQQITYGDFLPRILGMEYMMKYDLELLKSGYYDRYDPLCSGTTFNEFAGAVFRFGHSLLKPAFLRLNRNYRKAEEPLQLRHAFFNSDMLYAGQLHEHSLIKLFFISIKIVNLNFLKQRMR